MTKNTANELVQFNEVSLQFPDGTRALADIDLHIGQSEFISIVGPSGCGKTSILKLVAGFEQPTSGSISGLAKTELRNEVSYVFQDATLMPWATVEKNISLPLTLQGDVSDASRKRVQELIELVGLSEFAHSYPRELSGGMKMRVSIARALVTRPKLLLMDEPFAALDEITRERMNSELLDLWVGHDWTVIFVTHSVAEAVFLSNRIVVMSPRPGQIVKEIAVATPYPRTDEFRSSQTFFELGNQVSSTLRLTHE